MGRYRRRLPVELTIPAEHQPVEGFATVRMLFFGASRQGRVERARQLRARKFMADSAATGFDEDSMLPVAVKEKREEVAAAEPETTPLDDAFGEWPAELVVQECFHSIVGEDDQEEIGGADQASEGERQEFADDLTAAALKWLTEQLLRGAGLVRDTEAGRGED